MRATVGQICAVFKLRIGTMIAVCALAGLAVTPGESPPAWQIAVLGLAVLLSSASAGAFNHYVERDLDARMARTRNRPFVTGRFRPGLPWLWAIGALLVISVGGAAVILNVPAALHTFLGAFIYGVVYTVWLKRKTAWNIVWGGLAGSFAVLAGASAVDPGLAAAPVWLAIVLFFWTPPHFWSLAIALHDDYRMAGVPMLPVVVGDQKAAWIILGHTIVVAVASIMPAFYGLGWFYLTVALLGGAWFIYRSIRLVIAPSRNTAMANFFASLVQLGTLLTAAMLDPWFL